MPPYEGTRSGKYNTELTTPAETRPSSSVYPRFTLAWSDRGSNYIKNKYTKQEARVAYSDQKPEQSVTELHEALALEVEQKLTATWILSPIGREPISHNIPKTPEYRAALSIVAAACSIAREQEVDIVAESVVLLEADAKKRSPHFGEWSRDSLESPQ